jgi:hypothetical protein
MQRQMVSVLQIPTNTRLMSCTPGTPQHPEHEFAPNTSQSPYILTDATRTDSPAPGSPMPISSEPTQLPTSFPMSSASRFAVASNGAPDLSQRQRRRTVSNQRAVEFAQSTGRSNLGMPYTITNRTTRTNRSMALRSVMSTTSNNRPLEPKQDTADLGFGGFPTPLTVVARVAQRLAPETYAQVERRLTLVPGELLGPAPSPMAAAEGNEAPDHKGKHANRAESNDWTDDLESGLGRMVDYLKKGRLWVGRNSFLHIDDLSRDVLDRVGGVEYGAIRVLSWLVPAYFVGTQLCCFIIFSAYLESYHEYDSVFTSQVRNVPRPWFVRTAFTYQRFVLIHLQVLRLPGCLCLYRRRPLARRSRDGSFCRSEDTGCLPWGSDCGRQHAHGERLFSVLCTRN